MYTDISVILLFVDVVADPVTNWLNLVKRWSVTNLWFNRPLLLTIMSLLSIHGRRCRCKCNKIQQRAVTWPELLQGTQHPPKWPYCILSSLVINDFATTLAAPYRDTTKNYCCCNFTAFMRIVEALRQRHLRQKWFSSLPLVCQERAAYLLRQVCLWRLQTHFIYPPSYVDTSHWIGPTIAQPTKNAGTS